jgi:rubrerythrin
MTTAIEKLAALEARQSELKAQLGELNREIWTVQEQIAAEGRNQDARDAFVEAFGPIGPARLALVTEVLNRAKAVKRLHESNRTRRSFFALGAASSGQFDKRDDTSEKKWHTLTVAMLRIMSDDTASKSVELSDRVRMAEHKAHRALRKSFGFDRECRQCGADWKSSENGDECPRCAAWDGDHVKP